MMWMQVNRHTGECETRYNHMELVRVTDARGISNINIGLRNAGQPFDTEHHWYRPESPRDDFREEQEEIRRQRAFQLGWQPTMSFL